MNEEQEMRDSLGALLTESAPLTFTATDIARTARGRRHRRFAVLAAGLAVLLALPVAAYATFSGGTTLTVAHPRPEPRLKLPQPCVDGTGTHAGLPAREFGAMTAELTLLMLGVPAGQSRTIVSVHLPVLELRCAAGTRSIKVTTDTGLHTTATLVLTVASRPRGQFQDPAHVPGSAVYIRGSATRQMVGMCGTYCTFDFVLNGPNPRAYPFGSEKQLHTFLADPRILDAVRRLAG